MKFQSLPTPWLILCSSPFWVLEIIVIYLATTSGLYAGFGLFFFEALGDPSSRGLGAESQTLMKVQYSMSLE